MSGQAVIQTQPYVLVIGKTVHLGLYTIGVIEAARHYRDDMMSRSSKGNGASTTWTKAAVDFRRGFVNRSFIFCPR